MAARAFFTFGPDIAGEGVVEMVADAVKESRGRWMAEEMRKGPGLASSMRKASEWHVGKRCLFICNDMRGNEDSRCGYARLMSELRRERDDGCALLSTRDLAVAENLDEVHSVRFGVRDDKKAGEMLRKCAGLKEVVVKSSEGGIAESHKHALNRCGGLPVALGVAGKAIARIGMIMRKTGEVNEVEDAILQCSEELIKGSQAGQDQATKGYPTKKKWQGKSSIMQASPWKKQGFALTFSSLCRPKMGKTCYCPAFFLICRKTADALKLVACFLPVLK